ncbi:YvcK family protein [Candidatus Gracilibacteria bacterium]|nr:YvcK family protein [Candidatus Gracilibacteria bacterium]
MSKPSIVAIGGGGGASLVLRAVEEFAAQRSAVIAVTDTGRSTGLARQMAAIPAPGDLRATIAALAADPQGLYARLLDQRFRGAAAGAFDGMAFGNLLIAALSQLTGDFATAIATVSELVSCAATVLPVSTVDTQLCAELEDGSLRRGELAVRGLDKPPIKRLYLDPPAAAYTRSLAAIRSADLVVLGPGSFYTSVMATLLHDGMREALRETSACVVFVCNTTTQPGQTDGLRLADHVRVLSEWLGPEVLDAALLHRSSAVDPAVAARYAAAGLHVLASDAEDVAMVAALGVQVLIDDLAERAGGERALWNKQDTIRHNPVALGHALRQLLTAS